MSDGHLMKPNIENAIAKVVGILSETQAQSGMSREDCEDLKQALREMLSAALRN